MRILFISHLGFDKATGLCWSVPSSVSAQMEFDDCFWVNTRESSFKHWDAVGAFHRLTDIGGILSLSRIKEVFPNPSVVIFEGFYHMEAISFANELYQARIPYVIVPRGSLTRQAFHNHGFFNYLKKRLAVCLVFRRYAKRALAIQFLTEEEYRESGDKWNRRYYILPNGINAPAIGKSYLPHEGINIVYIGRPTIYHKGLDILVQACKTSLSFLKEAKVKINCYVPEKNDYNDFVDLVRDKGVEDIITIHPAVFGEDKERVLLCTDVFIMTSRFEGHPMGLIEAMSYGIPVAVTHGTNMSLEVANNNAGWTSECTADGVSKMLGRVVGEKDKFEIKGRNARILSSNYDWGKLAKLLHDELSFLVES